MSDGMDGRDSYAEVEEEKGGGGAEPGSGSAGKEFFLIFLQFAYWQARGALLVCHIKQQI